MCETNIRKISMLPHYSLDKALELALGNGYAK